ncbi:hypothetical protein GW17_00002400 [Ensete ventricosum]|nr:hypothetical protein GW17_00002400 [Ensete ventricosum]
MRSLNDVAEEKTAVKKSSPREVLTHGVVPRFFGHRCFRPLVKNAAKKLSHRLALWPGYCVGRRSIEGEGRKRRGHLKKRENKENLDVKPFLNPDLALPSLDDPDPGRNNEAMARAAKEAVSIASSVTLQLLLHRVLRRRPETSAAFDVFVAFYDRCRRWDEEEKRRRRREGFLILNYTAHIGGTYRFASKPIRGLPTIERYTWSDTGLFGRLREKHRRREERAFEEEGESGEPRHELVSTPFLDPDPTPPSLDDPDPVGNREEKHKEEDLEVQGLGEVAVRTAKEAVSFIA